MRSLLRSGLLVAILLVAVVATVAAQEAAPAAAPVSTLSGTMVGDRGGAYVTVEVDLPADADVTLKLEHWPCQTGDAIGFNVWSKDGWLAASEEMNACVQEASFNAGEGGMASIQVYNYLHGVGTWYSLSAEGIALPGAVAPAPAVEAAPAEPAEAAAPAEAKPEEAKPAEAPAAAAPAPAAPVAAAPAGTVTVEGATIFGDLGGAFGVHELAVEEGMEYEVEMTYGLDQGGEWRGVGFNVWCPSGLVAVGGKVDADTKSATFTADEDAVCGIQVYNYHHGKTLFYSLEAGEVAAE